MEQPRVQVTEDGKRFLLHLGGQSWHISLTELGQLAGSAMNCLRIAALSAAVELQEKKAPKPNVDLRAQFLKKFKEELQPMPLDTPGLKAMTRPLAEKAGLVEKPARVGLVTLQVQTRVLADLKAHPKVWRKWNNTINAWALEFLPGVAASSARERVRLALARIAEECDAPSKPGAHGGHVEFGKYRFRWVPGPMAHLCKCNHKKEDHDSGTGLCRQSVGKTGRRCACRDFRSRT